MQTEITRQPVFLDMDGSSDDLIALVMILTMPQYKLSGISLTNGNCYSEDALISISRILKLFGRTDIQVAISKAEAVTPFPDEWRAKGRFINELAVLKKITPEPTTFSSVEAAAFTSEKILSEVEKSIIVLTGPATNLANAIQETPELIEKIDKVLWMAGAFLANGNVNSPDHDGSAEWNIFWDPVSAQKLIQSGLKIVLFPLDVCNQVPVDNYLMYHLKKQSRYTLSRLVHSILNHLVNSHSNYYMWDVLPVSYLGCHDIMRLSNTSIDIEIRGTSKGNVFKTSKGSPVHYANCIDDEKFYSCFLKQLKVF